MKMVDIDIYELMEISKKKKIACFGAGKMFSSFLSVYGYIADKVDCIVDNAEEKAGKNYEYADKTIPIISFHHFTNRRENAQEYFLIISCFSAYDVYQQFDGIEGFEEMPCAFVNFIRSKTNELDEKNRNYPKDLRIFDTAVIPKVIHYCWFGNAEISEKNRKCIDSWKRFCPDYEIKRWDETNYDVSKNRYMKEAYECKKWAFVSDYARLDIVCRYGGIYLDTDVEIIKNLDDLLYQEAFAGVDCTKNINLGLGFGARAGFVVLKDLLDMYESASFYKNNGDIDMTPITVFMKPYFNKKGYVNNGDYQTVDGMSVYPEKILSGKCNYTGRIMTTADTYAIHHYDGSWADNKLSEARRTIKELYRLIQ